jgi:hypothetical protein
MKAAIGETILILVLGLMNWVIVRNIQRGLTTGVISGRFRPIDRRHHPIQFWILLVASIFVVAASIGVFALIMIKLARHENFFR